MSADTLTPRSYGVADAENDITALESKAEVASKDWLLARKRDIMRELAPLAAMHRANGQGSPADAARKRHRAVTAMLILGEIQKNGQKEPSEAALERMANAHESHRQFCDSLHAGATRYNVLMTEKEEIEYRLRARETELHAYSAEMKHL